MKKLSLILIICAFVSCNSNQSSGENADTSGIRLDKEQIVTDTLSVKVDTIGPKADSASVLKLDTVGKR